MKLLTLLLMISACIGCKNGMGVRNGIELVMLRGCEYAVYKDVNSYPVAMVHHADCHNPHHYGQKTYLEKMDSLSKAIGRYLDTARYNYNNGIGVAAEAKNGTGISIKGWNNRRQTARIVVLGEDGVAKEITVPYYPDTTYAEKIDSFGAIIATGKQDAWCYVGGRWQLIPSSDSIKMIVVIDKK